MFKGDMGVTVKTYLLPESVEEAVGYLKDYGSALMISGGGTHTMMLINNGYALPEAVMGLRRAGLNSVAVNGDISMGAMTTMSQIIKADLPDLLHIAAHNVGGRAIRNMGTVGGNLMMPAPAGDFAVALLALDATVHLVGAGGERSVSLADFYESGRVKSGELLAEIEMPIPAGKTAYVKYARRDANAPTIVTVAVHIVMDGDTVSEARIALNGAAQTPMRATEAENVLKGRALEPDTIAQAAAIAAEACDPFNDAIASEWYRRKMVKVYVARVLESLT
jgi:CO/xanthine dehydrogenase FAD-binding subunit